MAIKGLLSIENLKNPDFFNIRRFVFLFVLYSLISIWSANSVSKKDQKINELSKKLQTVKSEYVAVKTLLMHENKRSNLLRKAKNFNFLPSSKPITTIKLEYEN